MTGRTAPDVSKPWPLVGDAEFDRIPMEWRTRVADEIESALRRHVMDAWYPVSVDTVDGGFRCDLDRRWRPTGPDERTLEYETRHTRTAARLACAYPDEPVWAQYALHGARYLNDVMHDTKYGGSFWLVRRDGRPVAGHTKHAHSTAYLIAAFVEIWRVTGDPSALDAAHDAFDWLDRTLHDDEHGGYHGWATRDGRVILDRSDVPGWRRDVDPLGHAIGLKDLNVHSDLLESLRLLYAGGRNHAVGERAAEVYDIVTTQFTRPDAGMHYLLRADLTPVPGPVQPGYSFQSAYRLPPLAAALGRSREEALAFGRRLVDEALRVGWAGSRRGILEVVDGRRNRTWWVQTETLQSLVLLEVTTGTGEYRDRIEDMLAFVRDEMLDERYGGWYQTPVSEWSLVDRLRTRRWPKAHRWKDPSHEADMSLALIRMLRGLAPDDPLDDRPASKRVANQPS